MIGNKQHKDRQERDGHAVAQRFIAAWKKVIKDYDKQLINSERCLQSALYSHFREELKRETAEYVIYVEPPVHLSTDTSVEKRKRKYIDILVISKTDENIVFGAELKYTPKGEPREKDVASDLDKLSFIKNHRSKVDKVTVTIRRYLGPDGDENGKEEKRYGVAAGCVVAFAVFAMQEKFPAQEKKFWNKYYPFFGEGSIWKSQKSFPKKRLLICAALTMARKKPTAPVFLGRKD